MNIGKVSNKGGGGDKDNLLHFAPEKCFRPLFTELFGNDNYMTGDIRPGKAKKVVDITDICFPDESYNYIICNHVLEHIPDDAKAMSELYRVLKNGGTAFLSVPLRGETTYEDFSITVPEEREKHFGQYNHVRWYGTDDFRKRLEAAGFSVEMITPETLAGNQHLRILFGIDSTADKAGNVLFTAKKM